MLKQPHPTTPSAADRKYLEDLRRGFERDYHPQTTAERVLLEELIGAAQRLYHLNRLEEDHCQGAPDLATLGKLSRQRAAADRIFHRSLSMLENAKAQRISKLQNEPDSICEKNEPNPTPVPNKPNLSVEPNKPNPTPSDDSLHRQLEQQIITHGHRAAFREDEPETCYADDALELYFQLKDKIPLADLTRHVHTLTEDLS